MPLDSEHHTFLFLPGFSQYGNHTTAPFTFEISRLLKTRDQVSRILKAISLAGYITLNYPIPLLVTMGISSTQLCLSRREQDIDPG